MKTRNSALAALRRPGKARAGSARAPSDLSGTHPPRQGADQERSTAISSAQRPQRRPRLPRSASALFSSLLLLALFASFAPAAEQTRESYVASVEPICKTNKETSDRTLSGVKQLVKADKLKQAGERFAKAAAALEKAEHQLAAVPQPPADAAKLAKWLAGIKAEAALMRSIAAKFKQGDKARASSLVVKLTHNATTTNNLVIAFQFHYCKIDPSNYT